MKALHPRRPRKSQFKPGDKAIWFDEPLEISSVPDKKGFYEVKRPNGLTQKIHGDALLAPGEKPFSETHPAPPPKASGKFHGEGPNIGKTGRQKSLDKTHQTLTEHGWEYSHSRPSDFHHYRKTDPQGGRHLFLLSDWGQYTHQRPDIVTKGSNKLLDGGGPSHVDARKYIASETLTGKGEEIR